MNARTLAITVLGTALLLCTSPPANAAEIVFRETCSFSKKIPGWMGDTRLDYKVEKGTTLQSTSKNGVSAYCGQVLQHTPPFGWIPDDECLVANNGSIAALPGEKYTIETDCKVEDPFAHPFQLAELDAWKGKGPANLRGQAFLKTVGGDVKTCAGETVFLIPASPYFDQFLASGHAANLENADSQSVSSFRRGICDAQGNFSLNSLPARRWYVLTEVTWGVPHIEQPGERPGPVMSLLLGLPPVPMTDQQGGYLLQVINLQPGDNQTFLTDHDRS